MWDSLRKGTYIAVKSHEFVSNRLDTRAMSADILRESSVGAALLKDEAVMLGQGPATSRTHGPDNAGAVGTGDQADTSQMGSGHKV